MTKKIEEGTKVVAVTAFGEQKECVATSPVVMGRDFAIVWVAPFEEWEAARSAGRGPSSLAWPAEDVVAI